MKMLPSILCTALITSVVWGAVWAQQAKPVETPQIDSTATPIKQNLVGISAVTDYNDAEKTAKTLFDKLSSSPDLINQLRDVKTLELYLVYRSVEQNQLQISAAISATDLKQIAFQAITLPSGPYQILAPHNSSAQALSEAWQQLDSKRHLKAVVESYQLDSRGNFLGAHSLVTYQ